MPAAKVHALTARLPRLTRGEGVLETTFDHYAPVGPRRATETGADTDTRARRSVGSDAPDSQTTVRLSVGTSRSLWAISSIDTSRNVSTLALFTNRAGRYMSHTQASLIDTS